MGEGLKVRSVEKKINWMNLPHGDRPVLVLPVYKGGERFLRCLRSLDVAHLYFAAIVISVNSKSGSADLQHAIDFQASAGLPVEVLNTQRELSSMDHTRFWANELRRFGLPPEQMIMWIGHDDELDPDGLAFNCPSGVWPIDSDAMVLGPWKLRHESVNELYQVPDGESLETWTCFPAPDLMPVPSLEWVCSQLIHPTDLNLTGGIFPFGSVLQVIGFTYKKISGMRMEMTLATALGTRFVTELPTAITIVYGRADSDRATIPVQHARQDDRQLLAWLTRYALGSRQSRLRLVSTVGSLVALRLQVAIGRGKFPEEDWVVRYGS